MFGGPVKQGAKYSIHLFMLPKSILQQAHNVYSEYRIPNFKF